MPNKMTNYTKHIVKGTIIVFVISAISAFLGYLLRLVLARNLGVEDFGLFYAVFSFLGLLTILQTLGFDRSLVKFVSEFSSSKKHDLVKSSIMYAMIVELATNTIVLILVYLSSDYLSAHFFHNAKAAVVLNLMVIAFFIDNFVLILKYIFQGFQKMVLFSAIDFARMILILAVVFIGFKMNAGILSPVIGYIIAPIVLLFIFGGFLLRSVFPKFLSAKFVRDRKLFRGMSKYSFYVIATSIGVTIFGSIDTMLLTYFSGLKAVAFYNIAFPTAKIFRYFPEALGSILLPLTSELWVKKQNSLLKSGMEELYKYSIIITVPLVFILLSFAELIITILFGKEYLLAGSAMKILSIGMIFMSVHLINTSFFLGIGKPKTLSRIFYTAVIFNFAAGMLLIPKFGIIGAATATSLSYLLIMAYGLAEIRKIIPIGLPIVMWLKTLIAGLGFIAVIYLIKNFLALNFWLGAAVAMIASSLAYAGLLFMLKVICMKELKDLYKRAVI